MAAARTAFLCEVQGDGIHKECGDPDPAEGIPEGTGAVGYGENRYRKYPAFVEALSHRHERYNESLRQIEELEKMGEILCCVRMSRLRSDGWSAARRNCSRCMTLEGGMRL